MAYLLSQPSPGEEEWKVERGILSAKKGGDVRSRVTVGPS